MNAITLRPNNVEPLSDTDRMLAHDASQALSQLDAVSGLRLQAAGDGHVAPGFVLPAVAVSLLTEVLDLLAQGRSVIVMHDDAELTTQQAADVLNVSRPYVVKLLDAGALPHRKVGTHRRVHLGDVLAFKRVQDAQADAALTELVEQAQELGMGY